MTINAQQARELSAAGYSKAAQQKIAEQVEEGRQLEYRAQALAVWAKEKLDEALMVATEAGQTQAQVWFPECSDVMQRVETIIAGDYTALGYGVYGETDKESRLPKYIITLKWGK